MWYCLIQNHVWKCKISFKHVLDLLLDAEFSVKLIETVRIWNCHSFSNWKQHSVLCQMTQTQIRKQVNALLFMKLFSLYTEWHSEVLNTFQKLLLKKYIIFILKYCLLIEKQVCKLLISDTVNWLGHNCHPLRYSKLLLYT